jgi:hypothetical protein
MIEVEIHSLGLPEFKDVLCGTIVLSDLGKLHFMPNGPENTILFDNLKKMKLDRGTIDPDIDPQAWIEQLQYQFRTGYIWASTPKVR